MNYSTRTLIVTFRKSQFDLSNPQNDPDAFFSGNAFPGYERVLWKYLIINAVHVYLQPSFFDSFVVRSKEFDQIRDCEFNYRLRVAAFDDILHPKLRSQRRSNALLRNCHSLRDDMQAGLGAKIALIDTGYNAHPYLPATSFVEASYRSFASSRKWHSRVSIAQEVASFASLETEKFFSNSAMRYANVIDKTLHDYDTKLRDLETRISTDDWLTNVVKWYEGAQSMTDTPSTPIYPNLIGSFRRISFYSRNMLNDSFNITDNHGHGTMMAGFVAGRPPFAALSGSIKQAANELSTSPPSTQASHHVSDTIDFLDMTIRSLGLYDFDIPVLAPFSELLVIKCYDEEPAHGTTLGESNLLSDLLKGLEYAEKHGAHVAYVGVAFDVMDSHDVVPVVEMTKELKERGMVVVCPAGNTGKADLDWPAASPHALAISACRYDGILGKYDLSKYSCTTSRKRTRKAMDFCAYGGDEDELVFGLSNDCGFCYDQGTSISAAIATGIIAREASKKILKKVDDDYRGALEKCKLSHEHPTKRNPPNLSKISLQKAEMDMIISDIKARADVVNLNASLDATQRGSGIIKAT